LVTENWEAADAAFADRQPDYERKYAYYKLKDGQNLASVADYFSVDEAKLRKLNPGMVVPGTTVKVTPVEHPYAPTTGPNGKFNALTIITEDHGLLRIRQPYRYDTVVTTIPDLMNVLKRYNAIEQIGPKDFRINRAISIEGDIRLDVTAATVDKLELRSQPHDITCLCFDEASALLQDVKITTYDPTTGKPDLTYADERAFVRAKNGRMDAINVDFSYLGNDLPDAQKASERVNQAQKEGGTYGVSWRISDDMLGQEIATGWVERSRFTYNHFGAYTYGASGIMWRNNYFGHNEVYGLDPHDDSNNAMIENNLFDRNGKHGFIVSKRCNYNIIRNNTSVGNKLHGFMLHQDSDYNVIENNVAYDNVDNYVIFASDYDTIRNNLSYNARSSHIRINAQSRNTFVTNNTLLGGRRGVFLYGGVENAYIAKNTVHVGKEVLMTDGAKNVLFAHNTIDALAYKVVRKEDRLIFGPNDIDKTVTAKTASIPGSAPLPKGFTANKR
jgi:parallel beta-helix repeat protein